MVFSITCYLELLSAITTINQVNVQLYQAKSHMFYTVQTTSSNFVSKNWNQA